MREFPRGHSGMGCANRVRWHTPDAAVCLAADIDSACAIRRNEARSGSGSGLELREHSGPQAMVRVTVYWPQAVN